MTCLLGTLSGVLWLCLLREPTAPEFLRPLCASQRGGILLQAAGFGLLAASTICWVQHAGAEVGIPFALATMMLVGAPLAFLLPNAHWRSALHILLALTLGAGAISALTN